MEPCLDVLFQGAIFVQDLEAKHKTLTLTVCNNSAQIQVQVEHST